MADDGEFEDPQAAATIGKRLFSLKDIRMHESFSGLEEEFESFIFALEAEVAEMGWLALLEAARDAEAQIPTEDFML